MKKLFSKTIAVLTVVALAIALMVGVNVTKEAKAEGAAVPLQKWSFFQSGVHNTAEPGNTGYINSATLTDTSETITGWLPAPDGNKQRKEASAVSKGFNIDIKNNGWDNVYVDGKAISFNPWQVEADMYHVAAATNHRYTVKFKAKAETKKYVYVGISTDNPDVRPYGEDIIYNADGVTPAQQTIVLGQTDKEFTFVFTNWAGVDSFNINLMLGAFNYTVDYAGNDVSDIVNPLEANWHGIVSISDFSITDNGTEPASTEEPVFTTPAPATTKAPAPKPTTKPSVKKLDKVTKVKVKSVKKKKIKVSWKKVKNAKKYEIKVNSKTYKTSKASKVIKNKKFKKGKKVKVKVRAIAKGYTSGPWSKTVKKKITK